MKRAFIALALLACASIALAQSFPTRSITLISPFPPGGSTDAVARVMAERMRHTLGQAHRAEIEKWWPMIRAAGIKAE